MHYHFIMLTIAISTTIHGTPPRLTASRVNSQAPSIQIEHLEDNETHSNTTPYLYLHRESPWPTCWEMFECLQGCCKAIYILAKLTIEDAYRDHNGNRDH